MEHPEYTREILQRKAEELYAAVPGNVLSGKDNVEEEYYGITLFDPPIIGISSAQDDLYAGLKEVGVIGPWHMRPDEWLPSAKSVVSVFFPMSKAVKESNRMYKYKASKLWTIARIEGQNFIAAFTKAFCDWFAEQGYEAVAPCIDPRFQKVSMGKGIEGFPEMTPTTFGSRWSERHAAYISGLGTFGLSKGIITEKGMSGRFTSIIFSADAEPVTRPYTGIYDYCIRCGACIKKCPVRAITMEKGKNHPLCGIYQKVSGVIYSPRYGCGLCQTGVPCESRNPSEPLPKKC